MSSEVIRIQTENAQGVTPAPFGNEGEPIYALMITGDDALRRAPLIRVSVMGFLSQTYANRRLVMINMGGYEFDIEGMPTDRLTQVSIPMSPLGTARNASLDQVPPGAVWVQWDDDDWRHPRLMAAQYAMLCEENAQACLVRNHIKFALHQDAAWWTWHPGGYAGSPMCRRLAQPRFPDEQYHEDSSFIAQVKETLPWCLWSNPPHYYIKTIHGGNVSGTGGETLEDHPRGERDMHPESLAYFESILGLYGR